MSRSSRAPIRRRASSRIDAQGGAGAARRARRRDRRGIGARHRSDDERPRCAQGAALSARRRARALCRRMGRGGGRGHARARRGCGGTGRGRVRGAAAHRRSRGGARPGRAARPSRARHATCSIAANSSWGPVEEDFAASPHRVAYRARWHRSATVPIETFGVVARWDAAARAPRHLGVDPDAEISRSARARLAPARQRRARPFRRRCRRQLWRQARPQAQRARRAISRGGWACRCGSSRTGWRICAAATRMAPTASSMSRWRSTIDGIVRAMKMRALDDVGAYAGRAPFQLGKPVSAIVGPYRIASVAVRADQRRSPTRRRRRRCAASARRRPISPSRPAWIWSRARSAWTASSCAGATSSATTSSRTPSRAAATYDSGDYHAVLDKALAAADYPALVRRRDAARAAGTARRHRHFLLPRAERRQFRVRAAAQSQERDHDLDGRLPGQDRSRRAPSPRVMGTSSSGQGHETLRLDRGRRDPRARSRRRCASCARIRSAALPSQQPGRQPHGDHARRRRGGCGEEDQGDARRDRRAQSPRARRRTLEYRGGDVEPEGRSRRRR